MTVNRVLTNKDREELAPIIKLMWDTCPDMMSRKIPEANVQQAFVLDQVIKISRTVIPEPNILSVGCFEDTAYETLKIMGANIIGIDPAINFDLGSYLNSKHPFPAYDVVFATSVIEHVKNDEEFIRDMCVLLNKNGCGILTTDFKESYLPGNPLPYSDERFYTRYDLEVRLRSVLRQMGCDLIDKPDYTDTDDFVYQGHHYSFATFVFRKK